MQPNDDNVSEENVEVPQAEFTPGAQPPMQPEEPAVKDEFSPTETTPPSVDGFSEPPVSTPPAEPVESTRPTPPTEPVSFQPPVTETGPNPEPLQTSPAPAEVEPPKPAGFFGKLFGKK